MLRTRVRRPYALQDVGLQRVRVLVLVDQHVIEHGRELLARLRRRGERLPEQQQVVVVQDVLLALAAGVRLEHLADAVAFVDAPRVVALEDLAQFLPGVHRPRVDRRERVLAREPPLPAGEAELLAEQVHHVGRVGLVEHREVGPESERTPVQPDQAVRDGVERAAPHMRGVAVTAHAFGAREHLAGCTAAEREQQDPLRSHAALHQVTDARCERGGLPGPGTRHDQQRTVAEQRRRSLLRVEVVEHVFEAYNPFDARSRTVARGRDSFASASPRTLTAAGT